MAGTLVMLYKNFADSGILSHGLWLSGLPLTNMQDPDLQRVARSANTLNSSTLFFVDLGAPQAVDGVALGPSNLSPGATWRVRGFFDAAFTILVYDSGIQNISGSVIDWSTPAAWLEWEDPGFWYGIVSANEDELPQYLFRIMDTPATTQWWIIEIFDQANPDGFIDIGRLMIGKAFRPSINYTDNSLVADPLTDMQESLGGLRGYWERGIRRKATYGFPNLAETEIFGTIFDLALHSGVSRQVFVVPQPDDSVYGSRRSFFATLSKAPDITQILVERGSTAFDLEEVI